MITHHLLFPLCVVQEFSLIEGALNLFYPQHGKKMRYNEVHTHLEKGKNYCLKGIARKGVFQ